MPHPYLSKIAPFYLGNKALPKAILYAPLAGCSDFAFRQMSARFRPGLMYCEMVKMEPLLRGNVATLRLLDYEASMRPIGAQLCGSNPSLAGQAARIVEQLGFDVVDFNCGCPVDKVTKDGSGSAMLKTPERIGEAIAAMVAAVNIPVTVKIRAGWSDGQINAPEIVSIAEAAGAAAIAVHGRTREQGYRGAANWDYIKECKEAAKTIKVIGNGDLFSAAAVEKMFAHTSCDAVLISRGTMGQPWIVEDIERLLRGEDAAVRDLDWCRSMLLSHFQRIVAYEEERRALLHMRRIGCWYFKNAAKVREFRQKISTAQKLREVEELITDFRSEPVAEPFFENTYM